MKCPMYFKSSALFTNYLMHVISYLSHTAFSMSLAQVNKSEMYA